jgi:hypothetical protein
MKRLIDVKKVNDDLLRASLFFIKDIQATKVTGDFEKLIDLKEGIGKELPNTEYIKSVQARIKELRKHVAELHRMLPFVVRNLNKL